MTDDELMAIYGDGDVEALEVLFQRYHVSVYTFGLRMLNDSHAAEDVLQDTFLAVSRAAASYQPRGRFRTWLMRICRNRCLNLLGRERLRRTEADGTARTAEAAAPAEDCPSGALEARERMAVIRRAIATLPERQRSAIVLHAFEEMSYREIGEVLEAPVNTVKTLIHRARCTLAEALGMAERGQDEM